VIARRQYFAIGNKAFFAERITYPKATRQE
jgi:hypothetical protein